MAGLSEQQRRFADYILEGKTQIEAHRLAGYKGRTDNARAASASEILRNPNVAEYMAERQQNAAESAEVTLEWLLEQAKGVLQDARKDRAHAASVAAIKELGVLSGNRVEKSKRENVNRNVDDYTDSELIALLAEGNCEGTVAAASSETKPDRLH